MDREEIAVLPSALTTYVEDENREEPLMYFFARKSMPKGKVEEADEEPEEEEQEEGDDQEQPPNEPEGTRPEYLVKDISLTRQPDIDAIVNLIQGFANTLQGYIDHQHDFYDLSTDGNNRKSMLYKVAEESDIDLLNSLAGLVTDTVAFEDFIKSKFAKRTVVIEVPLDSEGHKKVFLFKMLRGSTYNAKKHKWYLQWFDNRDKIKLLDNQQGVLLDDQFEFAAYISDQQDEQSFFFIRNRKGFEDMLNYHEKYRTAFTAFTRQTTIVDWSNANQTVALLRQCYGIATFARRDECMTRLEEELLSQDDNETKRALTARQIPFTPNGNGRILIAPPGTREYKTLMKIINDGIVHTVLLGREGIADGFEELQ